jgi:8-oxo-dGTP diphosphatase
MLVVGAALFRDGRVLASRRVAPAHLAGLWEFPGGKVEEGESPEGALLRELAEELRLTATVGPQLGPDLVIGDDAVLRVFVCTEVQGTPQLVDHDEHRWLSAEELDDVPWIPVDAPLVAELRRQLRGISRTGPSGGADSAGPG